MTCLAHITLAATERVDLLEAIFIFLGLMAYVLPSILKRWQGRGADDGTPADSVEESRPGRRRRAPRAGGSFEGSERSQRERRKEPLERWRELLLGDEPAPVPKPRPRKISMPPAPAPAQGEVSDPSPTLIELRETIDELHEAFDQRHAELEETHTGLPSESLASPLVSPVLSEIPEEDLLEQQIGGSNDSGAMDGSISARSEVDRKTARPGARRAWRRAVVNAEILAPPIALRSPSEISGRMPG
jgi:hypothetical protein